jgi:hypothetical protein
LFQTSLATIRADIERNGWTRAGAAYCLDGDWPSAARILERALARDGGSIPDQLMLALAYHQMGRPNEARRNCDRGVDGLKNHMIDDETRDIAIEAILNIRGLSVDAAKSLLLDLAFPDDPFAHGAK